MNTNHESENTVKLRVRAKELQVSILLNKITLPDVPDWVFELSDELPNEFTGMALINVGTTEVVVEWDFSSELLTDLIGKLHSNVELSSASSWGPHQFRTWVQGVEVSGALGNIGIMVER